MCVCRPGQRTGDDLEIIYDELLHIKALAHLSNTVSQTLHFSFKETVQVSKTAFDTPELLAMVFLFLRLVGEVAVTVSNPPTRVMGHSFTHTLHKHSPCGGDLKSVPAPEVSLFLFKENFSLRINITCTTPECSHVITVL